MNKIIKINNVSKEKIIKNVNLSISNGECISIMGNSGAGKTTLANIISGLEKPTSGNVLFDGVDIVQLKEPNLTKFRSIAISYIFQDYKLIEYLNVEQNIKFIEKNNKSYIDEKKYNKLINDLGLTKIEKKTVSQLSGGQKQRVAIARAMIGESKVIIADEPTAALDMVNKKIVLNELKKLTKANNKTLIIITHDPEVALKCDRILIVSNGSISDEFSTNYVSYNEIENILIKNYKNENNA
ncbi:ABC transporter ATP-binding protein [Spiroplasma monobiae]|uniref:ABC transporter ATP-binding protein n=1 Tax=Spiroplasma monobiae MQ-1 TaxID=1336748 RepID=A0A2K9LU15_SPISQ|nr:ABC transporter ATP-binding protein [Spiroplasma monobiae]AUM62559.1 ABC transporter ATP-binding protein [Spiroplasma monobiae MQ-1]